MDALPGDLLARLRERAGAPTRHDADLGAHVGTYADGRLSASTDLPPTTAPAAAGPDAWAPVEAVTGQRVPGDLRDLYTVADGGFAPGIGDGLNPIARVVREYEDLRRRGPGYTREAEWPVTYLPISDTTGPVSYDLATGRIVAFNDYWYDDDLAVDDAFTRLAPDLATWLREWLVGRAAHAAFNRAARPRA